MYKKIIAALSLEHGIADQALKAAKALADEDAEILAVHVYEPLQDSVRHYVAQEDLEKARKQIELNLEKRIKDYSDVVPVILEGHAGRSLADFAEEVGADCIVIGSHKPGLRGFLLGSTAARVVRHAPCSVHVLR
jgi:nucleotide-binding universal stress UspA family protein